MALYFLVALVAALAMFRVCYGQIDASDEMLGFAMELALGTGQLGYGASNEVWRDGMRLVGLDLATFEKQVVAAEKTKKKPAAKTAPAKKTVAKKAPKRKAKKS